MPESKLRPLSSGLRTPEPKLRPLPSSSAPESGVTPPLDPKSPALSSHQRRLLPPRINGRSGGAHQRSGSRRPSGGSLPSSSGGGNLSTFHASGSPSPMVARPVSRGRRLTARRTPQRLRPPRSGAACIVPDARDPSRPRLCRTARTGRVRCLHRAGRAGHLCLSFSEELYLACSISQYFLGANLQEAGGQKAIVEEQAEDAAFIREELDHRET